MAGQPPAATPPEPGAAGSEPSVQPLQRSATAHLLRLPEVAMLTGLPLSLLRKSFMSEEKRPPNIPPPPPHKRIGRAIYVLSGQLTGWIDALGRPAGKRKRRASQPSAPDPRRRG